MHILSMVRVPLEFKIERNKKKVLAQFSTKMALLYHIAH